MIEPSAPLQAAGEPRQPLDVVRNGETPVAARVEAAPAPQIDLTSPQGLTAEAQRHGSLLYAVGGGWVSTGLGAYVLEQEHGLPQFEARPGGRETFTLRLQRAGRVRGRILDAAGKPIAGAVVRAHVHQDGKESIGGRPPGSAGREDQRVCSDKRGAFRIETLLPGVPYELLVERAGFAYATLRPFRAASGVTATVEVRMALK